jgi:hypothetical protein
MASQPSNILSQHDSELFDTPNSLVLKRMLSSASASASASTTANRRSSKV